MTFHSLFIFCRGRVLSLYSTSHLTTQARTPSLTDPFWTPSKSFQGMYSLKVLSSVLIYLDLDAQYVSSFTEVFHWKILIQVSFYAIQKFSIILINNMSSTYNIRNAAELPLTFYKYRLLQKSVQNYMLWPTHQSVYSNSEMLAPVHRWIAGACTLC